MKRTLGRMALIGGATVAATFGLLMSEADAHHPEVAASTSCSNGLAMVSIVSTSWTSEIEAERYNTNISISFDGVVIGSGRYLPSNDYSFGLTYFTPADGRAHTVRATALAPFGPQGEYDHTGEYRETSVTLPTNCVATTTTSAPGVTTTISGATTTVAPGNGATTTTVVVPIVVGGATETRTAVAVPVAAQPKFTG